MMRQYLEIKSKYASSLLFFRLGDFYEMFFDDAKTASHVLDIALTRRADVPMCGIPFHAAESYIARLIKAGHTVAICEQLEAVPTQGTICKRDVVRVITPGTVIESNLLQSDENNFLASAVITREKFALACVDISTGDFFLTVTEKSLDLFRGEIARFSPREIIFKSYDETDAAKYKGYLEGRNIPVRSLNEWIFDVEYLTKTILTVLSLKSLKGLGLESDIEILAAGSILEYLKETQKRSFDHIRHPKRIQKRDRMFLDDATISHLELTANQQDGGKARTIYAVLNRTQTAMGKRTLERNILQPLLDRGEIEERLSLVESLKSDRELSADCESALERIHDIERIISRMHMGKVFPKDFLSLSESIRASNDLCVRLESSGRKEFAGILEALPDMSFLADDIDATIVDEPALTPEQGQIVRTGVNAELDHLHTLKTDAKSWVVQYQEDEKNRLGINTLKVRYNRVLGYYIEISKGQTDKVGSDYLRKATLVNCERYTTEQLQRFETDVLCASEKIVELENALISRLHGECLASRDALQKLSSAIGVLDFHLSLAISARENRFVRPAFSDDSVFAVRDGRHPIVEKFYTREAFIPNDIDFNRGENRIKIITGPNMSGKSTYIRMAATIQLMGQIGSFVPAAEATLPIADRIFTRIGASDNISRGESTFLVEMNETATILNNATERSLIIMDEVGRGTSTYDGLSLAWAIVEYILMYIKANTLFATHYHELTRLADRNGIVNYNVKVSETAAGVEFLHKVVPGSADRSYGIHVARLAGIPKEITTKAQKILERLEKQSRKSSEHETKTESSDAQIELFNAANHLAIQAIRAIDLNTVTPIDALNELARLKKIIE
jgi:DNA mismatch repair protein MutS